MLAALLLAASLVSQYRPSWLDLGSRIVTSSVDHDAVTVVAAHGRFHAIKIAVRGSAMRFSRVVLRFENGDERELRLHGRIPAGGETSAIRLKGDERAIRSVDFWYDPGMVGSKGAVVQLLGSDRAD